MDRDLLLDGNRREPIISRRLRACWSRCWSVRSRRFRGCLWDSWSCCGAEDRDHPNSCSRAGHLRGRRIIRAHRRHDHRNNHSKIMDYGGRREDIPRVTDQETRPEIPLGKSLPRLETSQSTPPFFQLYFLLRLKISEICLKSLKVREKYFAEMGLFI